MRGKACFTLTPYPPAKVLYGGQVKYGAGSGLSHQGKGKLLHYCN
jgi:hypothetical protein